MPGATTSKLGRLLGTTLLLGLLAPFAGVAQTSSGAVPITAEPDHKIRFDNGKVRMYEVVLPKGKATQVHEHQHDSFNVFFRATEITNEPVGRPATVFRLPAGLVGFASTAKGPYSHRVVASGETMHVIAMELKSSSPSASPGAALRPAPPFKVALQNPRGRVYRLKLEPGEATGAFTRPANSVLFAVSAGRISESGEGKNARLWDFEPGYFRWFDSGETVTLKNEGPTPIDLVAIEVF